MAGTNVRSATSCTVIPRGRAEPIEGLPANLWAHGQGLFEVRADKAFATNRTIYLTYTALPEGSFKQKEN